MSNSPRGAAGAKIIVTLKQCNIKYMNFNIRLLTELGFPDSRCKLQPIVATNNTSYFTQTYGIVFSRVYFPIVNNSSSVQRLLACN